VGKHLVRVRDFERPGAAIYFAGALSTMSLTQRKPVFERPVSVAVFIRALGRYPRQ
jgi:hypothetical protein